ncbi:hypothetical protein F751_2701 [Auxenochlorella protothecoides]|uniref:YCII-related domain-containing protein n=1 Tax=Auxenochlorella protothecoides TaxID=3075 RepID=A0A087SL79_AUXPR|nr:hypothetical protein F751_2701 [Auxenochlorella protothecoides]KFM26483.1 hypothetical protein F751_2701 [Auxenochlorella protothecoides]RMZ56537.1 hypothetical protein APUTEX25_001384 [Auxenochlorella protothecoides]|eukprot:RMZ56537.1 hypothetical protein APUTEX25_001384 [Auxenochlorella protothecoides]
MQASAASGNTYHVLQYKFVPDMETKRAPVRQAHLDYLKNLADEKKLAMGGALVEPLDSSLLIFRNISKEEVEKIAVEDPYTKGDLVAEWTVRRYMRVVGDAE